MGGGGRNDSTNNNHRRIIKKTLRKRPLNSLSLSLSLQKQSRTRGEGKLAFKKWRRGGGGSTKFFFSRTSLVLHAPFEDNASQKRKKKFLQNCCSHFSIALCPKNTSRGVRKTARWQIMRINLHKIYIIRWKLRGGKNERLRRRGLQ